MTNELVTVATYQFLPEAEMNKLFLEEAGIPVFLADAETVNMDWFLANAIGRIKLQVPASQAAAAAEMLRKDLADRQARAASPGEANIERCLSCDAVMPANAVRCPACGWSYNDKDVA